MAALPDTAPISPPAAEAATDSALVGLDHEELVISRGRRSGVYTVVAVHSTALGPALGGCRMWRYPSSTEGARDGLRLSRAMTFKAAAAGLALGGGKGVICLPPGPPPNGAARRDMLLDFADTVNALDGSYITAEDVGTSSRDMVIVARQTRHVTGLPEVHGGSGDPSPFTARGVEAAMESCCAERFGSRELAGRTVSVVGCGRVGEQLARRASAAGAELVLADIDETKRGLARELPRARWTDPHAALLAEVDVLAPCALGSAIDELNVGLLRCQVVCGSANNQLAHDGLADDLAGRGILYAPDFIVNAGGLINVAQELSGYDRQRAVRRVDAIAQTTAEVLRAARAAGITPLAAAYELARRRLRGSAAAPITIDQAPGRRAATS
jgi:leucine dehydrogenase